MDDFLQAEEAEELDDNDGDVDDDGEEHTNHQDDGAGEDGGEDRTRDAGDQYDAGPEQQREAAAAVSGESNSLGRPAGAGPRGAAVAVTDESNSQEGQEERFEHGAPRATDALGAAGSDQTQGQHGQQGQQGQHGQHGQHEVTVLGTNQSVQRDAVSEPLTGGRKRVRTTHFWNR